MTTYTREELNGVRKYRRGLKVRRRRLIKKVTKDILRIAIAILLLSLMSKTFSLLGLDPVHEMSPLDKYPTPQSYIDHLNSTSDSHYRLTVEDLYGDLYSNTKEVR